jgi:uncharacterized membrane protein
MVPGIALFFMTVETEFYLLQRAYFVDIFKGADLKRVEQRRRGLVEALMRAGQALLLAQALVSVAALLLAPWLMAMGWLDRGERAIFQQGVLGAMFHTLLVALMVVLAYLDHRPAQLRVLTGFLLLNAALPLALLPLGERHDGQGYALAAMLALLLATQQVFSALRRLTWLVFVARNPSLRPPA